MIDHVNNLKLQHLVELSKLGERSETLQAEVDRRLREHDVVYDGRTVPFVLMPHFVSPGQLARVRRAVESLTRVLVRFCDAYSDDPRLREALGLSDWEDELIRIEPRFSNPLRVMRLDAFLHGYDIKFIEFNSDSPAGIGYTDVLFEALDATIELPRVEADFDTAYTPMLPQLLDTLLDAYRELRAGRADLPEKPRLAVVDVPGAPAEPEFRTVCGAARERGLEADFGTTEELSYDGRLLRMRGEPVHLVSRRVMLEDIGPDSDLVAAARDGSAAIVNPFRARVANNKKLLALLQDPRFEDLVGKQDADVVRATIPWTRLLRPGKVTYGDWVVDLLTFVSDNRERLVLKPASDYGGRGVTLGFETSDADWDEVIRAHCERGDYVVQEALPIPEEMFPSVEDGRVEMRLKRCNVNPFAIGGAYAGSLTRISDQAVINVSAGGGLLPSVVGRHKQKLLAEDSADGGRP